MNPSDYIKRDSMFGLLNDDERLAIIIVLLRRWNGVSVEELSQLTGVQKQRVVVIGNQLQNLDMATWEQQDEPIEEWELVTNENDRVIQRLGRCHANILEKSFTSGDSARTIRSMQLALDNEDGDGDGGVL